jgi:putative effector of murein hydrolase LrgA (UPF0299 family)
MIVLDYSSLIVVELLSILEGCICADFIALFVCNSSVSILIRLQAGRTGF